ncbi:uncharacterized protein [Onthophagus taurus]|uniref:uncharacterized protein n=1 Tax=Onthophagus taurus TaxID=166361 RepID=UPI0039BEA012
MNYVLNFCKITGKSRIFKRHFYLPLLKPQTPKDALRTFKITGKWLLGSKVQHYMPVLFNHRRKRSKSSKDYGKITHKLMKGYKYLTPVLDPNLESHQLLLNILKNKSGTGKFVYTIEDKKHNLVFSAELELAIRDGDIIDVLISHSSNKILLKLKDFKKVPIDLENFNLDEPMFNGEGQTSSEEEKFHHYGKFTMSLARIFEEKERELEEWELELMNIIERRKKQHGEGTIEWDDMVKEEIKNLNWKKFEKEAKQVIDTIFEEVEEEHIGMEVEDFEITKNVCDKIIENNALHLLPSMNEINDIVKNLGKAKPCIIGDTKKISGVKVILDNGKQLFVPGQMVKTDDGDVFVPGQTIENEFGLEYAPGITINLDGNPSLITGLIMAEENTQKPMFLPSESTITADGQLTFTTNPEERPKPIPKVEKTEKKSKKKKKKKKNKSENVNENLEAPKVINDTEIIIIEENLPVIEEPKPAIEEILNEIKLDDVAIDLIEETPSYLEETSFIDSKMGSMDNLTEDEYIPKDKETIEIKPIDDGMDDVIASVEEKKSDLQKKLEELRKITLPAGDDFVTYVTVDDANEIALKITDDEAKSYKLADILITLLRRASTFRERSKINMQNINNPIMLDSTVFITEADEKFFVANPNVKIALKSAAVAANDIFKKRPKDQALALSTMGDIIIDLLKDKNKILDEMCLLMNTPIDRNEISTSIFKELTQDIRENKVDLLKSFIDLCDKHEHIGMLDKVLDVLPDDNITTTAIKKLGKVDPELLYFVADNVEERINMVKTELAAMNLLEDSIIDAVKDFSNEKLQEFAILADKNALTDFVSEGIGVAKALGLQEVSESLNQILITTDLNIMTLDKSSLDLLKRLIIIRKLAERDYSCKTALERIRKNPDCGQTDPRIRQLVRESASLMLQPNPIKTSREIPLRLFRNENFLAIEDYLIRRNKGEHPILISRNGVQAVVPKEAARAVLAGRVPYLLIDESGVTNFKPMHMFNALKMSRNREKRYENYASVGGHEKLLDPESKKRQEKLYSPPKRSSAERYADRYNYSREPLPMTALYGASYRPRA